MASNASNTFDVNVVLDQATLIAIAHMADFEMLLYPNMLYAMEQSLDDLESMSQDWMWTHFMHPTGQLENAFEKYVIGPNDAQLWNDLPWAQRRNYGFSGMTDALGRYFPHDPGILWAEHAVENATPYVAMHVWEAYNKTLMGI